ncbi:MAG: ATP-grasp domain-containing protein, partial [Burkholderiales bacterium]|nr:ATP-grasp domain-containing protein [Burkholderiales bacterium]
ANRGEIAVRIIRSCQSLGYSTVAVYSDADRAALHVSMADQALCIGPGPAAQSYLAGDKLIAAAKASGAGAIHPGYGFLSERSDFAQAVQAAGLVFIGPDWQAIEAMGNKSSAKIRMLAAGVRCVPGYQGEAQSDASLLAEAIKIGLPVMVKAASGGGGRGMRLVQEAADLPAAIQSARSESVNAFGDGQLLIEKAVLQARHVEIQVFGDRHGNLVHIGERDCSVQRRHQKLVEESPSPAVDQALRARMGAAAVAAARAVDYVGAGTVEFLLARDGSFYFLEMNTRLQVEHPVTEAVYDLDLVAWQLRVARGEVLPLSQEAINARRSGWAMEVRLCTEDPANDFLPQTGRLLAWQPPQGRGMRVDHGLQQGDTVPVFYDSMQAKLIAAGETREEARRKLLQMLDQTLLLGLPSNRDYLRQIIAHPVFAQGDFSTSFVTEHLSPESFAASQVPTPLHSALAALLLYRGQALALQTDAALDAELLEWQSSAPSQVPMLLQCGERSLRVSVSALGDGHYRAEVEGQALDIQILEMQFPTARFMHAGLAAKASYMVAGSSVYLSYGGQTLSYADTTLAPVAKAAALGDGRMLAPMDGKVLRVLVTAGETVTKGQALAVLEAMKIEFVISSNADSLVTAVSCQTGQQVRARQLLISLAPGQKEVAASL